MKVLVTGIAGFVGRHVAADLEEAGHAVTGFDLADPGGRHRSIRGDLGDADAVMAAVRGHDAVCHVGAVGDVYLAAEHPALAAAVNVTGSAHVAAAALRHGAKVVYASTWEVYGPPEYEPIDEEHPTRPDHPYNITKLAGEHMLMAASRLQGLPMLSLRLGTGYGPGLRPNSVFRIFIDRARRGEPIVIQGDGSQGRQFTHVTDLARAFTLAVESDRTGLALNTVAGEAVSIKRLAEAVIRRHPTELRFVEARPGDVVPALVSSARIESVLGWRATIAFEEGLNGLLDLLEADPT